MITLLLGLASLLVLLAALDMFSKAKVSTVKQLLIWVAAIGGVLVAALLFFTGRGAIALSALLLLGPMVWSWIAQRNGAPRTGGGTPWSRQPPAAGGMTRVEACAVLGVRPGASEEEVRAAHRRLMQAAHPDRGGSDWLASRINQARDVLLG